PASGVSAQAAPNVIRKAPTYRSPSSPPNAIGLRRSFHSSALVRDDVVEYVVERAGGGPAGQAADPCDVGDAALHILEAVAVGLLVRDEAELGGRVGADHDLLGQLLHRDLVGGAAVVDCACG